LYGVENRALSGEQCQGHVRFDGPTRLTSPALNFKIRRTRFSLVDGGDILVWLSSPSTRSQHSAMRPSSILGGLLLLCAVRSGAAQVSGTVTGPDGAPIRSAAVELWTGARLSSMHLTNEGGQFRFSADEAPGASDVLVRHPGYSASRASVKPGAEVTLRLNPSPVELPGLTARVSRGRLCPNKDEPEARALWGTVAARYSRSLDTLGFGSNFSWDERTVASEGDIGPVRVAALQRGGGVGHPARRGRTAAWWASGGYGRRINGEGGYREFGAWYYPLDDMAVHLVSAPFGALHSFRVVGRGGAEIVIGFCPAPALDAREPHIEGLLRVSARDTLLSAAHVEFRTPSLNEHAGVDLVFAPARADDGRPLPVPATELFWRRPLGRSGFYQRYREYIRWELGSSDSTHIIRPLLDHKPE
jgi:hypothetical protein